MSSTEISPANLSGLRKRRFCPSPDLDDDMSCSQPSKLRAEMQIYQYVLESESSSNSDHDTESVHSVQDKETDYVRDTSDTDFDTDVEFEVASMSEDDEHMTSFWGEVPSEGSSGTDDVLGAEVLAAICAETDSDDSSDITIWAAAADADTDGEEESDADTSRSSTTKRTPQVKKCIQCKEVTVNPFYRYCDKCYQARKKVFPPRPRPYRSREQLRKRSTTEVKKSIVEPEKLRKYLTNLTQQDSGVGTSQEHSDEPTCSQKEKLSVDLGLDKIIVPEELISDTQKSECSQSGNFDKDMLNDKEMCIVCTETPKNSIFVHGSFGHMCCCYKCAMKVWTRTKRCPACNCKVNNVLKVFLR